MSEPDRFDAQARELLRDDCPHEGMRIAADCPDCLAAALRAEHASALERAREAIMPLHGPTIADAIARIDFLLDEVKPAAAPAAEQAGEAGGAAAPCNPRSTRSPATATGAEQRQPAPAADDKKLREPGCQCHQEEGDSPCPVHGGDDAYGEDDASQPEPTK